MTLVFKEWSYIVDALGKGFQSIILRKGGIAEEEGDFIVRGNKFLLMPTLFHQAEQMLKPDWLKKLDGNRFHKADNQVEIQYYAQVALQRNIDSWDVIEKINAEHAWSSETILERFNRWNKSVTMIVVQIYQLENPIQLEMLPEYSGCKSWIEIANDIDWKATPVVNQNIKGTFF